MGDPEKLASDIASYDHDGGGLLVAIRPCSPISAADLLTSNIARISRDCDLTHRLDTVARQAAARPPGGPALRWRTSCHSVEQQEEPSSRWAMIDMVFLLVIFHAARMSLTKNWIGDSQAVSGTFQGAPNLDGQCHAGRFGVHASSGDTRELRALVPPRAGDPSPGLPRADSDAAPASPAGHERDGGGGVGDFIFGCFCRPSGGGAP